MSLIDTIHGGYVYRRRVRVVAAHVAELIPQGASVLDVGSGDGLIARLVAEQRPDIGVEGVDVLVRAHTHIPVAQFDGRKLPHADKSVDVVTFIDMLHHTEDPMILLNEGSRVARQAVVIKDHALDGFLAGPTLRFMDWVGNARYGVVLPYNYWPEAKWRAAFATLNWKVDRWKRDLHLYPWLATWVFDRSLHFVARLEMREPVAGG